MSLRSRCVWALTGAGESANPASTTRDRAWAAISSSAGPMAVTTRLPGSASKSATPAPRRRVPRPSYTTSAVTTQRSGSPPPASGRARRPTSSGGRNGRDGRLGGGGGQDGGDGESPDDVVHAVALDGHEPGVDDLADDLALVGGVVLGAGLRHHVILHHRAAEVV